MRFALNLGKMEKGGFSRATIDDTHQVFKNPRADVREEKKRQVEFPGHKKVMAVIERHPAIIRENQKDSCRLFQIGTAKNLQSRWRRKSMGAPPPRPTPPGPPTQPSPPGDSDQHASTEIKGAPTEYVYIHTPLPNTQFFNHDAYAKDLKPDNDSIPDLLTDQGPSTG
jgi:hypothetical protein